jgi:hypothetical protein
VFGRRESLREQIRNQHEEFLRFMEKSEEKSQRWQEEVEETREFNREILLRNEKVYTRVIAEMEEGRKQLEEGTKQVRVNTQAILRLLDRFDQPGGATA